MKTLRSSLALVLAAFLFDIEVSAQDWSRFRGPNGSGIASGEGYPTELSAKTQAWKAEVPTSSSSPIVAGGKVFLAASRAEDLQVHCLDAASGEKIWSVEMARGREMEIYKDNDSACPTPVSDGENVYVFFPELGLISFSAEGEKRWQLELGPFVNFYGMASSPILAGDNLVLLCDQQRNSVLLGVDKDSGKRSWRVDRSEFVDSWATPVLRAMGDGREEVLVFGNRAVCAYSAATGEELWRKKGMGSGPVCSPVLVGDHLFLCVPNHAEQPMPAFDVLLTRFDKNDDDVLIPSELGDSPLGEHFGWVDTDKDDRILRAEWDYAAQEMLNPDYGMVALAFEEDDGKHAVRELWRHKRSLPSIGTPLVLGGVVYMLKDGGILTSLDAKSGEVVRSERLPDALGTCWPSLVAADGMIYAVQNEGLVTVLRAAAEWEALSSSELDEPVKGTPALANGAVYLRTATGVSCFRRPVGD